ncbi:6-phospho-3-hexuloisomerase [Treponema primitia]|uniref:6-phospho-3-hexuloisomerase n=1 Tax=Treponema primitia TaxID=88058 RepID=UPI00397EBFBE
MNNTEYAVAIAKELERTVLQIDAESGERLTDVILSSKRIFAAGAGRSGFMVKAFVMRLMHMGFESYMVGETITPNIGVGDILVIGSGSGETGSLVSMAQKAKKIGSTIALVSIFAESTIGKLADVIVKIPAPTPKINTDTGFKSIQPMGSLFEQSLLLTLDAVILRLMEKRGGDSDTMFSRHANLE